MDKFSYIGSHDVSAVEQLYSQYIQNPTEVDASWRDFFKGFEFAKTNFDNTSNSVDPNIVKEFKVIQLINNYRQRGHLFANTNPIRARRVFEPNLDLVNFELSVQDLETVFQAGNIIGIGPAKLKDIIAHLNETYCKRIGVEYVFMREPSSLQWLQSRMESSKNTKQFTTQEKKTILKKLTQAVLFENFLANKYVGQKRFSLEGAETVIPAIVALIHHGADNGIVDYVIGMAHRGRLNVLSNIMRKEYKDVFTEFEDRPSEDEYFDGDVKYHTGYSADIKSASGKDIHISLTPNPSHLETVAPVVQGIVRAKIDNKHQGNLSKACAISIHGDAAIAGQGIVYEVIQMSQLEGYKTGGTIHYIINNQVGFTTNYLDARSSTYCTDIAKVVLSPIFHVNGDDVEGLTFISQLAIEFRQTFHRDVFIDILCYRKYGHNEGDEPRFTQPLLYKAIATHANSKDIYVKKLHDENSEVAQDAKHIEQHIKDILDNSLTEAKKTLKTKVTSYLQGAWNGITMASDKDFETSPETAITKKIFLELAEKITTLPKDKTFFVKTQKLFDERKAMIQSNKFDWAMGELLAYGSILAENFAVRISGQDVERGTFSHRHAVVKTEDTEEKYTALNTINKNQQLKIYNSLLSEYGVLGFEYGYAFATPNALTIWEAQFGDFFNGAQIIIDQYLTSAEYKWRRMNGLVMLLPHGYEGQGPEHSSARMERFLQACAENNIQIVNATTPAQQFHVLRRQLKRNFRKPLVCFTPKKLLRYPACVSSIEDFTIGNFKEVINDTKEFANATSILFCSGKVYYSLIERRETEKLNHIAIIRIEQLYPFPKHQIDKLLKTYTKAKHFSFVQEEPENMGPWRFVDLNLRALNLKFIGRESSASPATGFSKRHNQEVELMLQMAMQK